MSSNNFLSASPSDDLVWEAMLGHLAMTIEERDREILTLMEALDPESTPEMMFATISQADPAAIIQAIHSANPTLDLATIDRVEPVVVARAILTTLAAAIGSPRPASSTHEMPAASPE